MQNRMLIVVGIFAAVLLLPAATRAEDEPNKAVPAVEQLKELAKQFNTEGFALRQAKTDEERIAIADRVKKLAWQLLDLAEKHANEPVAMDALVQTVILQLWMENNTPHPGWGKDSPGERAMTILLRDHVQSANAAEACRRMSYGFSKDCESFIRAVLLNNPQRDARGLACLRLAQFLNARLYRLDLLNLQPALLTRYEGLFGKENLDELRRQDRGAVLKEIESLFETVVRDYDDVKLPYATTIGDKARGELYEMRELGIGKMVPDFEGLDQDGQPFKLSDYRGKVVLLYFWSEY